MGTRHYPRLRMTPRTAGGYRSGIMYDSKMKLTFSNSLSVNVVGGDSTRKFQENENIISGSLVGRGGVSGGRKKYVRLLGV